VLFTITCIRNYASILAELKILYLAEALWYKDDKNVIFRPPDRHMRGGLTMRWHTLLHKDDKNFILQARAKECYNRCKYPFLSINSDRYKMNHIGASSERASLGIEQGVDCVFVSSREPSQTACQGSLFLGKGVIVASYSIPKPFVKGGVGKPRQKPPPTLQP
jgi:hypothetical protein